MTPEKYLEKKRLRPGKPGDRDIRGIAPVHKDPRVNMPLRDTPKDAVIH